MTSDIRELPLLPRDLSQNIINQRLGAVITALQSAEAEAKKLLIKYGRRNTSIRLRNREPHLFLRRSRAVLAPLMWADCIESNPRVFDLRNAASLLTETQRTELYELEKRRRHLNYRLSVLRSEQRRLQEYERLMHELPQPVNDTAS